MACQVEVLRSKSIADRASRWVLYVEHAPDAGPVIYSRRGPHSTTGRFNSLELARRYVDQHQLANQPTVRLVRIYNLPASA